MRRNRITRFADLPLKDDPSRPYGKENGEFPA